jgi:hypothetical protein
MCYQLTDTIWSEIIKKQNESVPEGVDFERIQKLLVLRQAKKTGDVKALRQWVCHLAGPEFGPELAKFIQPLPRGPWQRHPPKLKPGEAQRHISLLSAKAAVRLIRDIWRKHYGKSRRNPHYDEEAAEIAAYYYGVSVKDVRKKPSGRHKKPRAKHRQS